MEVEWIWALQKCTGMLSYETCIEWLYILTHKMVIIFLMLLKNPSLHHPRATFLGLTNEKIVLLSANSIRATVATENNKVQNSVHWWRNISCLNSWFSSSPCPFSIFSFSVFLTRSTNTKHLKPKESNPMYSFFIAGLSLYYNLAYGEGFFL